MKLVYRHGQNIVESAVGLKQLSGALSGADSTFPFTIPVRVSYGAGMWTKATATGPLGGVVEPLGRWLTAQKSGRLRPEPSFRRTSGTEGWLGSRPMPIAEDLHTPLTVLDTIEDQVWRTTQFSGAGMLSVRSADEGMLLQDGHPPDQGVPNPKGGCGVVTRDIPNNQLQVLDRLGTEDYFVSHEGTIFATSANGMPLPASKSRVASSSDARRRRSSASLISV